MSRRRNPNRRSHRGDRPDAPRVRAHEEVLHRRGPRHRPIKEQQACRHREDHDPDGRGAGEEARAGWEVDGGQLEVEEGAAAPRVPEAGGAGRRARHHRDVPVSRLRRGGAAPQGAPRRGRHGPRLHPPGRRAANALGRRAEAQS
jgi:hypothetical protein